MSDRLRGIVVCHGDLAKALIASVEEISGVQGALEAVSNAGCDRGELERRIVAAAGKGPGVVFVDLATGSCMIAAMRRLNDMPGVSVVTGVNLAMLVDFVFHRDLPPDAAANRAVAAGAKAIAVRV